MPIDDSLSAGVRVVTVGTRKVGLRQQPYVIAEAGVNHNGSVETALEMVAAAANAGADAVKFQVFTASELATPDAPTTAYQQAKVGNRLQRDMLAELELSDASFATIRDRCRELAIDFLATPFGDGDVSRLVTLGVPAIKTASTDLNNVRLLGAVVETGLPLFVSTGAATPVEIGEAVALLEGGGACERLVLLHCVSAYPAPLDSLNLCAIATMAGVFGLPVGFSDHADSTETGAWAVAHGAVVIEKHFTLDRNSAGPDHAMSLNPRQLALYINRVRDAFVAAGDGSIGMCELESEVRTVARKSIVAARDIAAGEVLGHDMLTLRRPGTGLAPGALTDLIGRTAAVAIRGGTILSREMAR